MQLLLRIGVALVAALLIIAAMYLWAGPAQSQPSDRCAPLPLFEYAMERIAEELMAVGLAGSQTV